MISMHAFGECGRAGAGERAFACSLISCRTTHPPYYNTRANFTTTLQLPPSTICCSSSARVVAMAGLLKKLCKLLTKHKEDVKKVA
jgi:hypothetical protein